MAPKVICSANRLRTLCATLQPQIALHVSTMARSGNVCALTVAAGRYSTRLSKVIGNANHVCGCACPGWPSNCKGRRGAFMRCFECFEAGKISDSVGFCHHCSAALCAEHAHVIVDPVTSHAPILKEIVLPKSARVLLCSICSAARDTASNRRTAGLRIAKNSPVCRYGGGTKGADLWNGNVRQKSVPPSFMRLNILG